MTTVDLMEISHRTSSVMVRVLEEFWGFDLDLAILIQIFGFLCWVFSF
jgi:hypothetical protein